MSYYNAKQPREPLAPCPFCGPVGIPVVMRPDYTTYAVECRRCHARGPVKGANCEAVEAWQYPSASAGR